MDIGSKKKSFKFHVKSASTSNVLGSPQSTNTPVTGRSLAQFVHVPFLTFKRCDMKKYIQTEEREYLKKKQIIESGYLTQRGMSKFLKPNRNYNILYLGLKWQKNDLKLHDTNLKTKLNIADIILNAKGGQSRRELLIEKIQNQIEVPKQIISQRSIQSEHTVQLFMDRLKFQSMPQKIKGDAQSPLKTIQSQKFIFNSSTTYQTE
ncbi:unnamed protein product (macronuclear) [Paramecium tetraurelia]|uniref:Uncharacterized protein n=1 Tax=Paramecium tetraurelia TaxID=5888 RepID=A0BXT8_PARTE|nr:uncharacterized protein GSPATT00033208001 [Paramecium tetraurelia]CAK63355.1 unnamed protein product [Paramecium tetraurelia]|eukprot:XP_001430753.1 hypothetical protein (macronuclear) [Paramecium tetraurelia strain d4-2]